VVQRKAGDGVHVLPEVPQVSEVKPSIFSVAFSHMVLVLVRWSAVHVLRTGFLSPAHVFRKLHHASLMQSILPHRLFLESAEVLHSAGN